MEVGSDARRLRGARVRSSRPRAAPGLRSGGHTMTPARSSLTAARKACPRLLDVVTQKGPASKEPEARRNSLSESAAPRRQDATMGRKAAPPLGFGRGTKDGPGESREGIRRTRRRKEYGR